MGRVEARFELRELGAVRKSRPDASSASSLPPSPQQSDLVPCLAQMATDFWSSSHQYVIIIPNIVL